MTYSRDVAVVYPLPLPLLVGESDLPACDLPASRAVTPAGSVHKSRDDNVVTDLLMCGGGVRSILLLPLVARCLETIDVCIWRMFMSVVVTVWGSVGMFVA